MPPRTMKMKIHDTVITQDQLDTCIARMKSEPFRAGDIAKVAIQSGVPEFVGREFIAHRVADRLIQKFRKARNIRVNYNSKYPMWTWVA